MEKRRAFLAENLPASFQNGTVEIRADRVDEKHVPEGLEVRKLVIPDIQTLKQIAGKSDEMFSLNLISDSFDDCNEEVPQDLKCLKECGDNNTQIMCGLMKRYVYGDSRKVAKYEKLLSRLYFPMEIKS